jgi:hypothetical protein
MRALLALAGLSVALGLAGCVGEQSRRARASVGFDEAAAERNVALHGPDGYTILELFHSDNISDKMRDTTGRSHGLEPAEFYHVQVAPDPADPLVLETAGYARKLEQDRGSIFLYEFYDTKWTRIALLGMQGDLYRVDAAGEHYVGKFQLDDAAKQLYNPPEGYGYDALQQDRTRVRMWDPEVAGMNPRARGVYHRPHGTAPAVLVLARLSPAQINQLADRFGPARFSEQQMQKLSTLREDRHGGVGQDEDYGGLQYKDGQPVDSQGRPLHRGALRD